MAKQNVPEPCKKIRDIEIGITMASSWIPGEEGTKDDVGATLEGPAGKAEVLLGSGLQKGESKWVKVDMQKYYKSDFVDIGGINNLNITAEAWWWTNGGSSTDQFKIQGKRKPELTRRLVTNNCLVRSSSSRKVRRPRIFYFG